MHVGQGNSNCHKLKIHEREMIEVKSQLYLGDIISNSGSNTNNIKYKCENGYSAISQIKSLLKDVGFGRFEIQTGLLSRDSIFMSKILLNSEVWHALTKTQIEELEVLDKILLRQILNAHSKTAIEWLYSDTGKFNLKSHIQIRRLMYLWHILSRNETELISRAYKTQKNSHNLGDWFKQIEADKNELEIFEQSEENSFKIKST